MLDTANGNITGTPTVANPFNFTAHVKDSSGSANGTVSDSCTINVTTTPYVCTIPPSGTQIGGGEHHLHHRVDGQRPGLRLAVERGSLHLLAGQQPGGDSALPRQRLPCWHASESAGAAVADPGPARWRWIELHGIVECDRERSLSGSTVAAPIATK